MYNEQCLNCKWGAYALTNRKKPEDSLIYCIKKEEMANLHDHCEDYQKNGSYKE